MEETNLIGPQYKCEEQVYPDTLLAVSFMLVMVAILYKRKPEFCLGIDKSIYHLP
jgi:hypothetical protein